MTGPAFGGGVDIAIKIPRADYDATVAFYRDTLGLPLEARDAADAPTVARTHALPFGPNTLWLDRVDTYSRMDVWLELRTDDLDAALQRLADDGVHPCDEIEPLDAPGARTRWIKDPAGVVHLLVEDANTTRSAPAGGLDQ
ncbi:VOC family protein [Nitriliruptor alkaliphilus]|uniref:VOC family protein n=1 Tax=Nitriliruptor alkaliphilus TaxID=427918 RepID=UPI000698B7DC|nr:VOC family protein [Nitriliruptor alkaliphilus]